MKEIEFKIAMPTDGEGIEKLNAAKYEKAILNELNGQFGNVKVSVDVFQHDGTGQDSISIDGVDQREELELRDRAEMLLPDALEHAYSDPDNYDE